MEAIEAIRTRRSIRSYQSDAVKEEDLNDILDCGRLAANGINRQSWRFVVVTDPSIKKKVVACAPTGAFIDQAAACVIVAIGQEAVTPLEDASSATVSMMIAANALGYGSCWIGAYQNETAKLLGEVIKLPEGWQVASLFALGVPDKTSEPQKKTLDQVVSYNQF
jgi:nitroreductase